MKIHHLALSWSTSLGRDTYGYNICRLDDRTNRKRYKTCGGGYDMIGVVFADWLEHNYQERLLALFSDKKEECGYAVKGYYRMGDYYGMTLTPARRVSLDGACGISAMRHIAEAIGLDVQWEGNRKGHTTGFFVVDNLS